MQLGTLIPSNTGEALGPTAISGGEVFAGAPATTFDVQEQGAVFVYTQPSGGWSGSPAASATLTASTPTIGDQLGSQVSVSGQTLAVGSANGKVYVFSEPVGGWTGTIHEVARLSASHGVRLTDPVISGQTIAAQGSAPKKPGEVYVFSEPAGGWSGALTESAKLTASDGTASDYLGASIAFSGTTIVAGAPGAKVGSANPGAVYVFTEPASGWSGTLHETAKLTGSGISSQHLIPPDFGRAMASSASTIAVAVGYRSGAGNGAVYVFTEPTGGWSSTTESAKLTPQAGTLDGYSPGVAALTVSGNTIAASGFENASPSPPALFLFTKPAGGWAGTLRQSATLVDSEDSGLGFPVISGHDVLAGAPSELDGTNVATVGPVFVFHEPSAGWSGTISQSAKLAGPGYTSSSTLGLPPQATSPLEFLFTEPAAGWSDDAPAATLTPPSNPTAVTFTSVAASGEVVVASGDGSAYVFSQPPGGWSSAEPIASLSDASGEGLDQVAISGDTVAALAAPLGGYTTKVDVFSSPSSGWSGQVQRAATLVASDRTQFDAVAVTGHTVIASGGEPGTWLYVWEEPAGGWAGKLTETARLRLPNDAFSPMFSVSPILSADGSTVVAGGVVSGSTVAAIQRAYVFTLPSGSWTGSLPPSAVLDRFRDAYSETDVYLEPASGWAGTVRPQARLLSGSPGELPADLAVAGGTVAVFSFQIPDRNDECPCPGDVSLFSKPSGGWRGLLRAAPSILVGSDENGNAALAISGNVLFAGRLSIPVGPTGVFNLGSPVAESFVTVGRPTVGKVWLTGLRVHKPRIMFTLAPGRYAPPIASMVVQLPRGLSFRRNHRGISTPAPSAIRIRRRTLTIYFMPGFFASAAPIYLSSPTLVASSSLRHVHHVKLSLTVTDAAGLRTRFALTAIVR